MDAWIYDLSACYLGERTFLSPMLCYLWFGMQKHDQILDSYSSKFDLEIYEGVSLRIFFMEEREEKEVLEENEEEEE